MKDKKTTVIGRQRWLIALLCVLLSVGVTVGAVFAFTNLVYKSPEQTIIASNIYFKVNGSTFRDTITEKSLSFTRGQSRDIDLKVEFLSSGSESSVEYAVELNLEGTAENNKLARAVEVYRKTTAGYEFFGMLSDLSGHTAKGIAVANQAATVESFRLVYSPAASDEYEGTTFKLSADVTGEVSTSTTVGNVVYVNKLTPLTFSANAGKVVRLMQDVEVMDSLIVDAPVLLDLNGFTLTMDSGSALSINYSDAASGSAYQTYDSLSGIINSKEDGGVVGALNIQNCGSDLYLLGDGVDFTQTTITFESGVKHGGKNGFFNALEYNYVNHVKGKTFANGEVVPLFANLAWYLDPVNDAATTYGGFTFSAESNAVEYNTTKRVAEAKNIDLTNNYSFSITADNGGVALSVRGGIKVRGSNAYSVAQSYIEAIPTEISSSLFFPTFDRATSLSLRWITDDGEQGNVFDSDGAYLKNGVDSLDDWSDRIIRIALIAGNNDGGASGSNAVGDYYMTAVQPTVVVMTAEQRTEKLYTTGQIILEETIAYKFADNFTAKYYLPAADASEIGINKTNISDITVDLGEEGAQYVKVDNTGLDTTLSVLKVPDKTSASFDITVTFTYSDNGGVAEKTYAFGKSVIVLGYSESVTLRNAQSTIQSWLDDTDYVKNGGGNYDFSIPSYLSGTGDYVEYVVEGNADYVFIKDDVYIQNAGGKFYKTDVGYKYFTGYYTTVGASADAFDIMLGSGEAAVYYKLTDNKNGASVIIDGQAYAFGGGENCYDRTSVFSVLPEKVPPHYVEVVITARIYKLDSEGKKLYVRTDGTYSLTWTETNPRVEYSVSFGVQGIYHNKSDEIADSSVYSILLKYYDLDGDGYVSHLEARAEWVQVDGGKWQLTADGITLADPSKSYSSNIINLSKLGTKSIKGLEYFINARGYNLSDNLISDLSHISKLIKVEHLDLVQNLITDISALEYMDELRYISLSNNNVTDISALEYLRGLTTVLLAENSIDDFLILSEHKNIARLDVRGNLGVGTSASRYAFSLIFENNRKNPNFKFYEIGDNPYTDTDAYNASVVENANSLRRLNDIGQVYKSLHLPTEVNGKAIEWRSSSSHIEIGLPLGDYYAYTIKTPPVDTAVTLTAYLDFGLTNEVSRSINILLLSDRADPDNSTVYLEKASGVFADMAAIVPDKVLRALLFNLVNSSSEALIDVGNGVMINDLRIITINEINGYSGNKNIFWQKKGLTDLTGIEYFANIFADDVQSSSLEISGNSITDLTPLAELTDLTSLKLGGMEYDFNQLLGDGTTTGLTSLTELYVYECYGITESLRTLYEVYLANPNISIYKDNAVTVWDPYAELMSAYVRTLPSMYTFMDVGDNYTLLGGKLDADGNAYVEFTFYNDYTIKFTVNEGIISGTEIYDNTSNTIALNKPVSRDTTSYVRYTLSGIDDKGAVVSYPSYYVELIAESNTRFMIELENGLVLPLDEVFTGYTLRAEVLTQLYSDALGLTADIESAKNSGSYCLVPLEKLNLITIPNLVIDGTYESNSPLGGLKYLINVTDLTISRDADLGDGSELVNISKLTIDSSLVNFSSLNTELPSLNSLTIKNSTTAPVLYKKSANPSYYEIKDSGETYLVPDHDYYLRYFTGLRELNLNENNNKITDWTFLFGLLMRTDAITGQTQWAQSHNLEKLNVYNNPNTYVSSTVSNLDEPVNHIALAMLNATLSGTFSVYGTDGTTAPKTYNAALGFGIVGLLYRTYTPFDITYPSLPSFYLLDGSTVFTMSDTSYTFNVDPSTEYAELNSAITETGATVGGELLSMLPDQTVDALGTGSVTLSLPLTTYAYTGTDFGDDSHFSRAFGISWSIYGKSSSLGVEVTGGTMTNLTKELTVTQSYTQSLNIFSYVFDEQAAPTKDKYKDAALQITLTPLSDYYIVVVGTIGEYYYNNNLEKWETFSTTQTKYSYIYPLLIKKSATTPDTSFAKVTDSAWRLWLFMACYDEKYDGSLAPYMGATVGVPYPSQLKLSYGTDGDMGIIVALRIGGGNPEVNKGLNAVFGNSNANIRALNSVVTDLTGLDILQGLTLLWFKDVPLTNADAVSNLTKLTQVSLTSTSLTYVPKLPASMQNATFGKSNITDLSNLSTSVNNSLTSLNLSDNDIPASMLKHLYDPKSGVNYIPNIKTLDLRNNLCSNDYALVEWSHLFLNASGLNVTGAMLNNWAVNKDNLSTLRTNLSGFKYSTATESNVFKQFIPYQENQEWEDYCNSLLSKSNVFEYTSASLGVTNNVITNNNVSMGFINSKSVSFLRDKTLIKELTLNVNVYPSGTTPSCWLSSSSPLHVPVTFKDDAKQVIQIKGANSGSVAYDPSIFDGNLIVYLLEVSGYTTEGTNNEIYKLNSESLTIDGNYGISSLKNINKLGFSSIYIGKNYLLSSLWDSTETYNELTSFTMDAARLSASDLAVFKNAPNCTTLDLKSVRGIDYTLVDNDALTKIKTFSGGGNFLRQGTTTNGKEIKSIREAYIEFLEGNLVVGGMRIGTVNSVTAAHNYRSGIGYHVNPTKLYADVLSYAYSFTNTKDSFDSVAKLIPSGVLYNSNDMFFTLSNADVGSLYTFMGGAHRKNESVTTDGQTLTTIMRLPNGSSIGESVSYKDLTNPMTITLPKSFNYGGAVNYITWDVKYNNTEVTSIFIADNIFTLSATNIDKLNSTTAAVTLSITATVVGKLTKTSDIYVTEVETGSSSGGSVADTTIYEYYVENSGGNVTLASDVFASGRLIEWIFGGVGGFDGTKYGNNIIVDGSNYIKDSASTTTYGVSVTMNKGWGIPANAAQGHTFTYNGEVLGSNDRVLTYDFSQRLHSIDTTSGDGSNSASLASLGITSLVGVERFSNLKEVYIMSGDITDLSPLSTLHLSLFSYQNAHSESSYISDFTPLVKGSKDTLEVLIYDSFMKHIQAEDMSFLLALSTLKEVYLFGTSPYNSYSVPSWHAPDAFGTNIQAIESPAFSYLVSALSRTEARLYMGVNNAGKVKELLNDSSWAGRFDDIRISPKYDAKGTKNFNLNGVELRPKDSEAMVSALMAFNTQSSNYFTVENGYSLTLNDGGVTVDANRLTVSARLPAMLVAGYLYAIDWQSGSSYLSVNSYGITGSININNVIYNEQSSFASYAEFKSFLDQNETAVYNAMNNGKFDVYVNVSIKLPKRVSADGSYENTIYKSFLTLGLRVEKDGTAYERKLSVDIQNTLNSII